MSNTFKVVFWSIFVLSMISAVVQISIVTYAGVSVVKEVNENNGSVGKTIGKFIGEVKKGME